MVYDTAIVGTGPAGVSAALNLSVHRKQFVWIGSRRLSDKITKAERISNYPGFFDATGEELNRAFLGQIQKMHIEIEDRMVNSIMKFNGNFVLMAGDNAYEARTVILTTGVTMKNMLPGEGSHVGKGVSYCATCDGGLYRGRTIAVICNNKRFEHEVSYLAGLAACVHFFPQYPDPSGLPENVVRHGGRVKGIEGEESVTGVVAEEGTIAVDGVFILRDTIALDVLLKDLKTEDGHILVDRSMACSVPGVFAAGDCTGRPYQYAKAVGEGNVAAHSVIEFLDS